MPTDDERREIARKLRAIDPDDFSSYSEEAYAIDSALGIWEDSDTYTFHYLADFIEPEPERTCKWVWGEEWLESSPIGPRELQRANWYLDCGCWDGFEDELENLCDPAEKPGHWRYCPNCGAKVVDECGR